ncbi:MULTISPECIES: hypothetical protein [Burkholderia cepacia complex]|uniref:hypothetical protein n=1 Tax=Burkholderia cepacia complex TaxID=87882 RepID=UPI0012DA8AEC|nr:MULTISPECIES: hypothetical protein [Burkholderia cepacia complex]QOH39442.1 hypothetical protein C7S14_0469 [Burkholderia cepacia]
MPKHFNVRAHRLEGIAIDVSVDVFSERFINLLMSLAGHALQEGCHALRRDRSARHDKNVQKWIIHAPW